MSDSPSLSGKVALVTGGSRGIGRAIAQRKRPMRAAVPRTMRACVIDRFGGPEELRLAEVPTPTPAAGEALVRIAYGSVNTLLVRPDDSPAPRAGVSRSTRRSAGTQGRNPSMRAPRFVLCLATVLGLTTPALAQEDVAPGAPPFQEGDTIPFDQVEKLKPFLPPEFWDNRDFFFYEGMQLRIGPAQRDYSPAAEYVAMTEKHRGQSKLGPENSLSAHVAGLPFPGKIDCKTDPQAGAKIIWNFDWRWQGDGSQARFYYSYWDRGEELPLYYEGTSKTIKLTGRAEKEYEASGADLFRGDQRKHVFGAEVDAPFDARGILLMTYRYKASERPKAEAKNDDTWVYVPTLRRVRRISSAQRTDAVSGTDFTLDDLRSFDGIVPQYDWECLGQDLPILAPMNTKVPGYPYSRDHNFGPFGLSFADDNWELRSAYKIRFIPRNADHPYHHKDIYLDGQTFQPLYSFAYDRKGELWKLLWHNHRWSGEEIEGTEPQPWYPGWNGVAEPRDVRVVSDIIVNVQTGTGNRIEFWDSSGTPLASKGKVRRYIDVGRLTKGR